jgi:hypothetical protein
VFDGDVAVGNVAAADTDPAVAVVELGDQVALMPLIDVVIEGPSLAWPHVRSELAHL